jgi:hypothetical protein
LNKTGSAQDPHRSGTKIGISECSIYVFILTTAAGIPGLREIAAQKVRNRLRQCGIQPRQSYIGQIVTQVHRRARVR